MTAKGDFPTELRRLIEYLEDAGFEVVYGGVEPIGSPGFLAEQDEGAVVQVTGRVQTWFVTVITGEGRVDDSWDRPTRVREEVRRLLDAGGES